MKKSLLLVIICAFYLNSYSQQLRNTEWLTLNKMTLDTNTVLAKTDSVFIIDDMGQTLVTSLFSENADTLSIVDVSGPFSCSAPDTGHYMFEINVDTLVFYLLTDSCSSRAGILDSAVLWRVNKPTLIPEELTDNSYISIYPNPNSGTFYIDGNVDGNVQVFSIDGKLVYQKILNKEENKVVSTIDNGIYVLLIQTKTGLKRHKLIIDK